MHITATCLAPIEQVAVLVYSTGSLHRKHIAYCAKLIWVKTFIHARHFVLRLALTYRSMCHGIGPYKGQAMRFWFQAGRSNGFTAGVQLRPYGPLSKPLQYMQSKDMSQMSHDIADHLSYAVAYSPLPSTSYAGGELARCKHMHMSLLLSTCLCVMHAVSWVQPATYGSEQAIMCIVVAWRYCMCNAATSCSGLVSSCCKHDVSPPHVASTVTSYSDPFWLLHING